MKLIPAGNREKAAREFAGIISEKERLPQRRSSLPIWDVALSGLVQIPPVATDPQFHQQRDFEGVRVLHSIFHQSR
jgi:hypothetical protein